MDKLLSTVTYAKLLNWSVPFLKNTDLGYKKEYNLYRIGDFLSRNRNTHAIEDSRKYQRVKVKLYNKGVLQRDIVFGKNIGTKKQYLISPGQFIMSKIDARNGAFGIVPPKLDGAIVTADFLTYNVDTEKISPRFLTLLTTTDQFVRFCQSSSSGTTGRQRVKEKEFLDIRIPLPDLTKQNRILDSYYEKIDNALKYDEHAGSLEKKGEKLFYDDLGVIYNPTKPLLKKNGLQFVQYTSVTKWSLNHLLKSKLYSFKNCVYDVVPLHTILTRFDGGKTPSKSHKDYWHNGTVCWTSPKDFDGLILTDSKDKITKAAINSGGMKLFPKGTVLGVFRSGILRRTFPVMLTEVETTINQDLKAMTVDTEKVETLYFFYYLHIFHKMILEGAAKVGVTVESINTEEFLNLPFVAPPPNKQKEIASKIFDIKEKIKEKKTLAKALRLSAIEEFGKEIFE